MKKAYMKPDLYVENFSLTQSIAAGCTALGKGLGEPSLSSEQTCGWDLGGMTYFSLKTVPDCTADEIVYVCYNAPNGNVMFAS